MSAVGRGVRVECVRGGGARLRTARGLRGRAHPSAPVGVCHEVVVVRGKDFGGEGRGVVCLWVFCGRLWGVCVN